MSLVLRPVCHLTLFPTILYQPTARAFPLFGPFQHLHYYRTPPAAADSAWLRGSAAGALAGGAWGPGGVQGLGPLLAAPHQSPDGEVPPLCDRCRHACLFLYCPSRSGAMGTRRLSWTRAPDVRISWGMDAWRKLPRVAPPGNVLSIVTLHPAKMEQMVFEGSGLYHRQHAQYVVNEFDGHELTSWLQAAIRRNGILSS
jgi:hypothetical protein